MPSQISYTATFFHLNLLLNLSDSLALPAPTSCSLIMAHRYPLTNIEALDSLFQILMCTSHIFLELLLYLIYAVICFTCNKEKASLFSLISLLMQSTITNIATLKKSFYTGLTPVLYTSFYLKICVHQYK